MSRRKAMPQRCGSSCPTCTESDSATFTGRCPKCDSTTATTGRSLGCCSCFASLVILDYVAPTDDSVPAAQASFSITLTMKTTETLTDEDGTCADPFAVCADSVAVAYFERVNDTCYVRLRCEYLGIGLGSELSWELSESTCDTLHFSSAVPVGGTVVLSAEKPNTYELSDGELIPDCILTCCDPPACYGFTINGALIVDGVQDQTFGVGVSMNETVDVRPAGYSGASNTSCTMRGIGTGTASGGASVFVEGYLSGTNLYVSVEVCTAATADSCVGIYYVYSVELHEPGTPCDSNLPAVLLTTGANYDYGGQGRSITYDVITEIVPDAECIPPSSPCSVYPRCITFRMSGVANNGCSTCTTFNGYVYLYRTAGSCIWYSSSYVSDLCISYSGGAYAQWVGIYDDATTEWTLSFIVFDGDGNALGTLVIYTLTDSSSVFPKTFARDSFSGACATWPSALAVYACRGVNLQYGACCHGGAGGPCEDMTEEDCDAIGGTFAGSGTRCDLEGCSQCATDCDTFCDEYQLRFIITDVCVGNYDTTIPLVRDGAGGGPCEWYGESPENWRAWMTVNTAVSPPVRTIEIQPNFSLNLVIELEQNHEANCTAPIVVFAVSSWTSVDCPIQPDDGSLSFTLSNGATPGCPLFHLT